MDFLARGRTFNTAAFCSALIPSTSNLFRMADAALASL